MPNPNKLQIHAPMGAVIEIIPIASNEQPSLTYTGASSGNAVPPVLNRSTLYPILSAAYAVVVPTPPAPTEAALTAFIEAAFGTGFVVADPVTDGRTPTAQVIDRPPNAQEISAWIAAAYDTDAIALPVPQAAVDAFLAGLGAAGFLG